MVLTEEFNPLANPSVTALPTMQEQIEKDKAQQQSVPRGTGDMLMEFFSRFLMAFTPSLNRLKEQASLWAGGQNTWLGRVLDSMILRKGGSGIAYDEVDSAIEGMASSNMSMDEYDAQRADVELWEFNRQRTAQWKATQEAGGFTGDGVAGNAPVGSATTETPAPQNKPVVTPNGP